jgi:hypothetical protein
MALSAVSADGFICRWLYLPMALSADGFICRVCRRLTGSVDGCQKYVFCE